MTLNDENRERMARADLDRVTRAATQAKQSREALRVAIQLAHASGESYTDIATAAGLSRARIAQIVREKS